MPPTLRTIMRSLVIAGLAAVMAGVSVSSARQFPNEFGDSEPGSLLFGVLHLTIALSAAAAALGIVRRAPWASGAVAVCGSAAVALLVAQPLYTSMDVDTARSIWLGAGLVGVAAAVVFWGARRLRRMDSDSRIRTARVATAEGESPLLEAVRSPDLGIPTARPAEERVDRGA